MHAAPCLESNWSQTVFSSCWGTIQTGRQRHSQYLLTGSPIVLKHAILLASCHFPLTFWSNKQCEVLFGLVVTTCDNCDRNHMGQLENRGHATRIRWIATVLEIFCTMILVALKGKELWWYLWEINIVHLCVSDSFCHNMWVISNASSCVGVTNLFKDFLSQQQ